MFVSLVDRIVSVEPMKQVRAVKNLSFREDYLRDHFPGYPIMPGALQMEAMIQAAQWLLRSSLDFPRADFQVRSVANARYTKYVRPGDQVEVTVTLAKQRGDLYRFRGIAEVNGIRVALAQFELVRYEAAWTGGPGEEEAAAMIRSLRETFARLSRGLAPEFADPGATKDEAAGSGDVPGGRS